MKGKDTPADTLTFQQWLDVLDRVVEARVGVSLHDLQDMVYRDWYDEGLNIREAYECFKEGLDWLEPGCGEFL